MYFLPRNNKFFSYVVHLNHNYRYGLTLIICSMFVCFWIIAIHFPLQHAIKHSTQEIKQLNNQLNICDQATGACVTLTSAIETMKAAVKKHSLSGSHVQDAILFMIDQAHKNNLFVQDCTIEDEIDQQWYKEHAVILDIAGTFNHIIKFFEAIKNSEHIITLKQFNLALTNENNYSLKGMLHVLEIK